MLLPGRPTERLSCVSTVFVEQGPLRFGFPLRVFKVSLQQPSVCAGGGVHQQAMQFVRQDKHRSVSALQTAHSVFRLLHSPAPFQLQLLIGSVALYRSQWKICTCFSRSGLA